MKSVYMDHSTTTPVEPEVFHAMNPYYTEICPPWDSKEGKRWSIRKK